MACNTCQSKFSFFTRENACPSCGFSYCSKCLKYKVELPTIGVKKVCGPCYNKSQKRKMSTDENIESSSCVDGNEQILAPVDITKKLELLENPAKPPIVMYKQELTHWDKLKAGMDPVDQEIIDRLKKLKGEDHQAPPPSVDEINRRLAILKGQHLESIETSPIDINAVDSRTDEEKRDDLLKEYMQQLHIQQQSVDDLQKRHDLLKGLDPSKIASKVDYDEDDETVTKRIIQKALEEAAIEAKYGPVDEEQEIEMGMKSEDNEEEPMCDDCGDTDGLTYCKGCKNKLYCDLCFEDNHDEDEVDMQKHIRVPFKESPKD